MAPVTRQEAQSCAYREIHLVQRPDGFPDAAQFKEVSKDMPRATEGQILVRNIYLSVDPYMREMMNAEWSLHSALEGRAIAQVVDPGNSGLARGTWVFHRDSWRTHSVLNATDYRLLPTYAGVPQSTFLSLLGGTGLTAYVALTQIARIAPKENIFVTAAAGGVGTAVAQLARLMGAGNIIGSTSSATKAAFLVESLGYDVAIDYSAGALSEQLAEYAPNGFEVAIDQVGGPQLEAIIANIRDFGRIAWVGAISQYNNKTPHPAPRNLYDVVGKSLRLEGFLVRNYRHLQSALETFLVPHLQSGCVQAIETHYAGLEHMAPAFIDMLAGKTKGKVIVQVAEPLHV